MRAHTSGPAVAISLLCIALCWSLSAATASRLSVTGHAVKVFLHGKRPEPVLADPAHHRVYVGYESSAVVTAVDDRTYRVLGTVAAGHEVEDLALDPGTRLLYSANRTSNTVSVINTRTLQLVTNIAISKGPNGVALDPALHRLYVSVGASDRVAVVNTLTNRVIRTLSTPGLPQGVGVDTILHRVFVALNKGDAVVAIDGRGLSRLASLPVGGHPVHPLAVDSLRHRAYVVNSSSSTLSIINTRTLRVARTLATSTSPEGITLDPVASRLYISNEGDPGTDKNSGSSASAIDLSSGKIVGTFAVLLGPDGITWDRNTSTIWVADENSGKVSVMKIVG